MPYTQEQIKNIYECIENGDASLLIDSLNALKSQNKKDINWEDLKNPQTQETPLHSVVSNGNLQMLEILISAGADIQCCDKSGNTPLETAITKLQKSKDKDSAFDMVLLLLKNGAIIHDDEIMELYYRRDLLKIATENKKENIVNILNGKKNPSSVISTSNVRSMTEINISDREF